MTAIPRYSPLAASFIELMAGPGNGNETYFVVRGTVCIVTREKDEVDHELASGKFARGPPAPCPAVRVQLSTRLDVRASSWTEFSFKNRKRRRATDAFNDSH